MGETVKTVEKYKEAGRNHSGILLSLMLMSVVNDLVTIPSKALLWPYLYVHRFK